MYCIIAANLSNVFQLGFGYRLFIRYNSRALQNRLCKLFFFYRYKNFGYLLFVFRTGSKLKFPVKYEKLNSAFFAVFFF